MLKRLFVEKLEDRRMMVVEFDDPSAILVGPGGGYESVGRFDFTREDGVSTFGTATLLSSGRHVLTAAHNVVKEDGPPLFPEDIIESQSTVTFTLASGDDVYQIANIVPHSEYLRNPQTPGFHETGADIAIVELTEVVDSAIPRHDIYRDFDEVDQVFTRVGFGRSGTGASGSTISDGLKRAGQNTFDADASQLNPHKSQLIKGDFNGPQNYSQGVYLISDFDSGLIGEDTLGQLGIAVDTGLEGATTGPAGSESQSAPGDSGGPLFIGDRIAGITSHAVTLSTDPTGVASDFGEIAVDVRVSAYADWIDAIIAPGKIAEVESNDSITALASTAPLPLGFLSPEKSQL